MRVDKLLCEKGLARSRTEAQRMIEEGAVYLGTRQIKKSSEDIPDTETLAVEGYDKEYVSRAGKKIEAAFDRFSVDISGRVALDVGASTGGFTQCMINRGAVCVYAVDSGHGQLAPELISDDRVVSIEGFNARNLTPKVLDGSKVSVITMDVSFISQTAIIPALPPLCEMGAVFAALIKPQFEAGREYVGRGGIVKDKKGYRISIEKTVTAAAMNGFALRGVMNSPILGGDGNREFLAVYEYIGTTALLPDFKEIFREVEI
ncbi:MAG: TlyA family RNA methyltransferase [Clostridia bacterium]|nr:TlyA family RNA methyltransferase [Clostridia bacterium]